MFFKKPPKYVQKIKCKKCGKKFFAEDSFCSQCGTKTRLLDSDIIGKKHKEKDIRDVYNYYYNSGDRLIAQDSKDAIEANIKVMYKSFPQHTQAIIHSSIRSGYALRKSEEHIFEKKPTDKDINLKKIQQTYSDYYKKFKSVTTNENSISILLIASYLSAENRYKKYGKESIVKKYLKDLVMNNISYMMPMLEKIYSGKEYLSIGGFPYVYKEEISFTESIKKGWVQNIHIDTILGYCIKLSERLIDTI
jgi:hypothetical protein